MDSLSRFRLFSFSSSSLIIVLFLFYRSVVGQSLPFPASDIWAKDSELHGFRGILRDEAVAMIKQLGKISDSDGYLERTFLSPASKIATKLIISWMEDAGLQTWVDPIGNIHGRILAANSSADTLLLGSHMDTVIDAGMYDGPLGIISAISALKVLNVTGELQSLRRHVEIIAFSDEEGVRFQSTFLGSAVIAGVLPLKSLNMTDKSGLTVGDVLRYNSFDPTEEALLELKYDPEKIWGYIEVHIEQGPVLEHLGQSVGVVEGIAGQSRLKVTVKGTQGHAGTVPMHMRQDPMAASAELIVLLENLCRNPEKFMSWSDSDESSLAGLVCTVGEISCWPSASNVIPGQVVFTVDVRVMNNKAREAVLYQLSDQIYQICDRRTVGCTIDNNHNADAVMCDSDLSLQLKNAAHSGLNILSSDSGEITDEIPKLMSGAGHDAMAISHLTKVAMLFVRCRGGVSHSPVEYVLDNDVWAAGITILEFLRKM